MKIPYFDAHCDTIGMGLKPGESLRDNKCCIDLTRGASFARYAQVFALFGDADELPAGQKWDVCRA